MAPLFNRAILFDVTNNSWHGLSRVCKLPEGIYRKSIAIYYLTDLPKNINHRSRALFSLVDDQESMIDDISQFQHMLKTNKK